MDQPSGTLRTGSSASGEGDGADVGVFGPTVGEGPAVDARCVVDDGAAVGDGDGPATVVTLGDVPGCGGDVADAAGLFSEGERESASLVVPPVDTCSSLDASSSPQAVTSMPASSAPSITSHFRPKQRSIPPIFRLSLER